MIKKLQKKYALSEQGAKDLIKGCLACVLQNLSLMFPVGLLYYMVSDLMNGGVPQCGQLKPRMLKIQQFWAYILDFFI